MVLLGRVIDEEVLEDTYPTFEKRRRPPRFLEETEDPPSPTDLQLIVSKMRSATGVLRERFGERLRGSKVPDWICDRTAIYEGAIVALAGLIQESAMPESVRGGGLRELALGAEALLQLFTNQIPLKKMDDEMAVPDPIGKMEGYFNYPGTEQKRLIIEYRSGTVFSKRLQHDLAPTCQIKIKNICGITPRGRAIAGPDSEIRLGLRCSKFNTKNQWTVTIESGAHDLDKKKLCIRPLSQAIRACNLDNDISPFIYHYGKPDPLISTWDALSGFYFFNKTLVSIFEDSVRPNYHQLLANNRSRGNPRVGLKKNGLLGTCPERSRRIC